MCDDITELDNESKFNVGELSRRGFTALSAAALAACATSPPNAHQVVEQEVKIKTADGEADAYFVAPATGKHPAVLVWPDIMGLRPAFRVMGKRLAESGYAVLTINPFYRKQAGQVFDATTEKFSDPPVRTRLVALMQSLTADTNKTDAIACINWLDQQPQVDTKRGVGTTGYCMGGPLVMRTAAALPNRVKAAGTFHGGGMATAQPNSPHLMVPQMTASFLVAVAENDDKTDPTAKDKLREAFKAKGLPAEVEVYAAQHGWCPPDSQVYHPALAEKAWSRLLNLFDTNLA
jgi:carboxymethylenebutenolidase